jgi:hypothetical protein
MLKKQNSSSPQHSKALPSTEQKVIIPNNLFSSNNPVPSRTTRYFRYSDVYTLTAAAVTNQFGTEQSFRLGSLFDPDFGIGGHQPLGFDQMAAFYNQYLVEAVDINIEIVDPSADGLCLGWQLKNDDSTQTVSTQLIGQVDERPLCGVRFINDSGTQTESLSFPNVKLHQLTGMSKEQYEAQTSNYGARVSTNPSRNTYFSVAAASLSGSADTVKVLVRFNFKAQLFVRMGLPMS